MNHHIVPRCEHDDGTHNDGSERGNLRVRHAPVKLGVDAYKLDQEAADAAEEQVLAGEEAKREAFATTLPEPPADGEREEELVDRGRLNEGVRRIGRDQRVPLHMDAPRQRGVDAVVAIAGGEAADAAYAVADSRSRSGEVQHAERSFATLQVVGASEVALDHEHRNAGEQAAKPGESGLKPVQKPEQDIHRMMPGGQHDLAPGDEEFVGILKLVPGFGPDYAGEGNHGDDAESVRIYAISHEILV